MERARLKGGETHPDAESHWSSKRILQAFSMLCAGTALALGAPRVSREFSAGIPATIDWNGATCRFNYRRNTKRLI